MKKCFNCGVELSRSGFKKLYRENSRLWAKVVCVNCGKKNRLEVKT